MTTFNAPIYITKDKQKTTALGTTDKEVYQHIIEVYKGMGIVDSSLSNQDAEKSLREMGLGSDFDFLHQDLTNSNQLFEVIEKDNRNELLPAKHRHELIKAIDNMQQTIDRCKNSTTGLFSSYLFNIEERHILDISRKQLDLLITQIPTDSVDIKVFSSHFAGLFSELASSSKDSPKKIVILKDLSKAVSVLYNNLTIYSNEHAIKQQATDPNQNLANTTTVFKEKVQKMTEQTQEKSKGPGFLPNN